MLSFLLKHRYVMINIALLAAFLVALYWAIGWIIPFIVPLLIGLGIALVIDPFVRFLTKQWRIPRWIAALFALVLILGGGLTLIIVLSAKLVIELVSLLSSLPTLVNYLVTQFSGDFFRIYDWISQWMATPSGAQLTAQIQSNIGKIANTLTQLGVTMVSSVLHFAQNVPGIVTIFVISVFIGYFISKDLPALKIKTGSLVPTNIQQKGVIVYHDLLTAVGGYIRAQLMLISITAVQVLAGLLILHVPYAFSLALLAAFLDILPLLGTGSLFVPWTIFAFASGDIRLGIGLAILYGLIVLVRQMMEPRIVAGTIGLDPLAMIVTMYAGYVAYGFLGIFLAPFLLIVIQSLLKVGIFSLVTEGPPDDLRKPPRPPFQR